MSSCARPLHVIAEMVGPGQRVEGLGLEQHEAADLAGATSKRIEQQDSAARESHAPLHLPSHVPEHSPPHSPLPEDLPVESLLQQLPVRARWCTDLVATPRRSLSKTPSTHSAQWALPGATSLAAAIQASSANSTPGGGITPFSMAQTSRSCSVWQQQFVQHSWAEAQPQPQSSQG